MSIYGTCDECGSETVDYCCASCLSQREVDFLTSKEKRACDYTEKYGITAYLERHCKSAWLPLRRTCHSPNADFWADNDEGYHNGYPSWADAVIALGKWMDEQNAPTD